MSVPLSPNFLLCCQCLKSFQFLVPLCGLFSVFLAGLEFTAVLWHSLPVLGYTSIAALSLEAPSGSFATGNQCPFVEGNVPALLCCQCLPLGSPCLSLLCESFRSNQLSDILISYFSLCFALLFENYRKTLWCSSVILAF